MQSTGRNDGNSRRTVENFEDVILCLSIRTRMFVEAVVERQEACQLNKLALIGQKVPISPSFH